MCPKRSTLVCVALKVHALVGLCAISYGLKYIERETCSELFNQYTGNWFRVMPFQTTFTNVTNTNHCEESTSRSTTCVDIQHEVYSTKNHNWYPTNHGDIITQADVVKSQYLSLPYPPIPTKTLKNEKTFYAGGLTNITYNISPSISLEYINHFLFRGGNNFMNRFRTLHPGGGTDGGLLYMAEQLNHTDSETVYVDFSLTTMSIAKARTIVRKLFKTVWVLDWMESIPRLGIGQFDFVECSGVLHHLKSPQRGLNILKEGQRKNGGAHLMVYGRYGRAGIYHIQYLLRVINVQTKTMHEEVTNAKHALRILPKYHWFHHVGVYDYYGMGDVGIYDLLLHKRDVSYSVTDLYEWLGRSNLYLIDFAAHYLRDGLSLKLLVGEDLLYRKLAQMNIAQRMSIAEIVAGLRSIKQDFYVSKLENAEASLESVDTVVFPHGSPLGIRNAVNSRSNYRQLRNRTYVFARLSFYNIDKSFANVSHLVNGQGLTAAFAWPFSDFNNFALLSLTRSPMKPKAVTEIIHNFRKEGNSSLISEDPNQSFTELYMYLKDTGLFLLKRKAILKELWYNRMY